MRSPWPTLVRSPPPHPRAPSPAPPDPAAAAAGEEGGRHGRDGGWRWGGGGRPTAARVRPPGVARSSVWRGRERGAWRGGISPPLALGRAPPGGRGGISRAPLAILPPQPLARGGARPPLLLASSA